MSEVTHSSAGPLPTREPTAEEKKIIDDILDLYQLKPSHQAYSHYASNAIFHDPVSIAEGLDSIKSQFNGMPILFSQSITEYVAVLDSSTPQSLQLNLTQNYIFKLGGSKTMNSKVTLNRTGDGLIIEHLEEWDHEANQTANDGFIGKLQEGRKTLTAKLIHATVPSDPDKL